LVTVALGSFGAWCYHRGSDVGTQPISSNNKDEAVNRTELRQLAEDRILDAQALLAGGRWSGAYYLTGYAAECGLKSCVLAFVEATGEIFKDKKYSEKCWTHNCEELVKLADLNTVLSSDILSNSVLARNWFVLGRWNERARYQQKTQKEAEDLFSAVNDKTNGVLQWIRVHW
jgi:hypothetical protein